MPFPCTGCGACCMGVDKVPEFVATYPDWVGPDGICTNLRDDMSCAIYEERPLICRIDALFERVGGPHPRLREMIRPMALKNDRLSFYRWTAAGCKRVQDEFIDNLPEDKVVTDEACQTAARMGGRDPVDSCFCPNCGAPLLERGCKILCTNESSCGYRVTCSEF